MTTLKQCLEQAEENRRAGSGPINYAELAGLCYERPGMYLQAIDAYQTGIDAYQHGNPNPKNMHQFMVIGSDLVLHLSVDLDRMGRIEEARKWWRTIYDYSSSRRQTDSTMDSAVTAIIDRRWKQGFGSLHDEIASYSGGLWPMGSYADQAQHLTPDVLKGLSLAAGGRYTDAASLLRKVVHALPEFQEADSFLGTVELARGKTADARKAFELSLLYARSRTIGFGGPDATQVEALRLLLERT